MTDGNITPDANTSTARQIKTAPTLRPTMIWLGLVVVLGFGAIGYINTRRSAFANPETANILIEVIAILTVIGILRFLVRIYILKRTRYVIDDKSVIRKYDLLFKSWRREVPFSMVRSHELRQSRIQKLLGYGTIGLNEGLGPVELENVPEPHSMYETLQKRVRNH